MRYSSVKLDCLILIQFEELFQNDLDREYNVEFDAEEFNDVDLNNLKDVERYLSENDELESTLCEAMTRQLLLLVVGYSYKITKIIKIE